MFRKLIKKIEQGVTQPQMRVTASSDTESVSFTVFFFFLFAHPVMSVWVCCYFIESFMIKTL